MNDNIYILIGKNIKKFREKKKYSIKDLSLMTNIDLKDLEKIELEGVDGNITFEVLNTICKCLDINMIDLFHK